MPKIRYLRIRFSQPVFPYEIPRFRAAVIEKTNREAPLFHNHKAESGVIYRYPLIQYKVTHKKASIICVNEGTDEIHHLLRYRDMELRVGDVVNNYSVEDVDIQYFQVQTWQAGFDYSLLNWLALNQEHHKRFKELENDEKEQIKMLESILTGNILSFAKGIGWNVQERIQAKITKIREIKPLPFKGRDVLAFSVNFCSNVSFPDFVGLGKGASIGFGIVKRINVERKSIDDSYGYH
jgi:hypothetical protein